MTSAGNSTMSRTLTGSAEQADMLELFTEYRRSRGLESRNRLVEAQLSLAEKVARDYAHRGVEADDLRQVAMLALVKAVERFDPEHGAKFSAFASVTINGEIKRYFRDHGWSVRPPRRIQEAHLAVRRATDALTSLSGRVPTPEEIATYLDCDVDEVVAATAATDAYRAVGLDAPATHDEFMTIGHGLGGDDIGFDRCVESETMRAAMAGLPPRDREIVRLRFWDERTQSEIAAEVGVSQMHVSRLLRRIVGELRRHVADEPEAESPPHGTVTAE